MIVSQVGIPAPVQNHGRCKGRARSGCVRFWRNGLRSGVSLAASETARGRYRAAGLPGAGFHRGGKLLPGCGGDGEFGAGAVLGVADGDQVAGVTDLNAVTAVRAGVAGGTPAALAWAVHLFIASVINSS